MHGGGGDSQRPIVAGVPVAAGGLTPVQRRRVAEDAGCAVGECGLERNLAVVIERVKSVGMRKRVDGEVGGGASTQSLAFAGDFDDFLAIGEIEAAVVGGPPGCCG